MSVDNMADGEIRKIDRDNKKMTIKHGDIKSLDMPGMTMVFQIRDTALLEAFKAGDKVKFVAEKLDGAFVVTGMQLAK
jgi:Cu/Ag efflux protein CusF